MTPQQTRRLNQLLGVAIVVAGGCLAWLVADRLRAPQEAADAVAQAPAPLIDAATVDAVAEQHYRLGQRGLQARTPAGLQTALREFQQALERDPEYAPAWAGLAMAWFVLPAYTAHERADAARRSLVAAREAVRLAPGDAAAQTALAAALGATGIAGPASTEALAAYDLALAIDPGYATAHHWKGVALAESGDFAAGEASLRAALAIDPALHPARAYLGLVLSLQGRWADALGECEAARQGAPDLRGNLAQLYLAAAMLGREANYLPALRGFFELGGSDPALADRIAAALRDPANAPAARAGLNELLARGGAHGPLLSLLALLGEEDAIGAFWRMQPEPKAAERYAAGPYARMNQALAQAWRERSTKR